MKTKKSKTQVGKKSAARKSMKKAVKPRRPTSRVALKGTLLGKAPKAELQHVAWSAVEVEELNPLLGRHFVVGQNIMVARVLLKKGCMVPEHSHHNEQISYITEGALKFVVDGRELVLREGEVLTIPPNMPHSAEALEDTVSVDIFDPPRADWINKTDAYLR
jgi:quercetin dioxygenase-like cupin family protein